MGFGGCELEMREQLELGSKISEPDKSNLQFDMGSGEQ